MTNEEPKIIGIAKKLKDNPILKQICERIAYADSDSHLGELIADARLDTDAANFASNIPALAESLILAYEALEKHKTLTCGCCADLTAQHALERISSLNA